jgi:cation transport ATPase
LSFALTIPVVFWSTEVQHWLGYTAPSFPASTWIAPILGIVVAFGTSVAATLGLFEIDVWWELSSLITIMVLGHWLEMRAISQARGALNALAALLPDTAERVNGTEIQTVALSELHAGDVVLVRPGTRVPADGTVVEGSADVDESMITGESRTVSKAPGAAVIAGTVASGGSLRVRVTAVGEQTALSGIRRLVAAAQASGSRTQALADRAAAILFYVAVEQVAPLIYLDTHMLCGVYYGSGMCVRNHCGAEPPRDIEPPGLVTTVGERDRDLSQPGSRTCSSSSRRKRAAMIPCLPKYPTTWPGSFRSTTGKRPILLSNIFAEASCKASSG